MLFRLLVVFLLSFSFAYALSDYQLELRAKKHLKNSSKSEQFLAYNDYKTLYLHSILKDDDKLRYKALVGIVKSAKKLHIDVSKYKEELATFKPKKSTTKKLKIKPISKNINELQKVYFKNGELVLDFLKDIGKKDIKFFRSFNDKKRSYKYIFDIRSTSIFGSKKFKKNGIKRIQVASFNKKTVRLVIENRTKIKVKFRVHRDKMYVHIGSYNKKTFPINKRVEKKKVYKSRSVPTKKKTKKVIVIDAGHGGKDPGAIGYRGYREKVIVFDIAKKLASILKSRGYEVYMTRNKDKFVKLSKRTQFANKKHADIFVSIHANAVGKKYADEVAGIETYFLSRSRSKRAEKVAEKENSADLSEMKRYMKQNHFSTLNRYKTIDSNRLALDLQRNMLGVLNKSYSDVKDAGVREGPFWVLVGAEMPSVLIEVGFISNPKEARRLVSSRYQQKIALGMANGIERYFINNR